MYVPIILKDGSEKTVKWGRRNEEEYPLKLPLGGWARAESIEKWAKFRPVRCYIPAIEFYEKGYKKFTNGHPIVGLLCRADDINVVYVITVPAPPDYQHIHDCFPMLRKGYLKICY